MPRLRDLVRLGDQGPVVVSTGVPVAQVLDRLEAGESLSGVGLVTLDLLAAIVFDGMGEDGPGLVQAPPRRPRLKNSLDEPALASLFPALSVSARLAISAGLLQVHDFWDASHAAAQDADDQGERPTAAYWHAIAHRREPDPGNASYWFRRVGRHPIYTPLAQEARPLVKAEAPTLLGRLLPDDAWNPFEFLTICIPSPADPGVAHLARELQRLEMLLLLEASLPS